MNREKKKGEVTSGVRGLFLNPPPPSWSSDKLDPPMSPPVTAVGPAPRSTGSAPAPTAAHAAGTAPTAHATPPAAVVLEVSTAAATATSTATLERRLARARVLNFRLRVRHLSFFLLELSARELKTDSQQECTETHLKPGTNDKNRW